MKTSLILAFLLGLLPVHADTTDGESGIFPFDIRESTGTTEVESAALGLNAQDYGNSASSASAVFAVGTQSGNLDALVIDTIHAPSSVVAGQPYAFPVQASFAGTGGSLIDVSVSARWFIVGNAPAGTHFEGNKLIAGNVTVPTVIRVSAAFSFLSGQREAVPMEVTIQPSISPYKVVATYSAVGPIPVSHMAFYTLTCNAATDSPQGAASPQDVTWDLDQDGDFDDASGLQTTRSYTAGQTVRIGVRAEWPTGVGPPNSASSFFFVTMDKSSVAGEPPHGRATDILNGAFMDSDGQVAVPIEARKANGLVILTHGLWGSGTDGWLQQMRDAILDRLSASPPNVMIYDWKKMSDPTAYQTNNKISGQTEPGIFQLDDYKTIRPYGKSQGLLIADWIDRQRQLGRVDRDSKIHLIGHSAGGFAMGECVSVLKQRLYSQVQVTMLDTPLPYQSHIKTDWRTERYVSSWIGGNPTETMQVAAWNLACLGAWSMVDHFYVKGLNWINPEVGWDALVKPGSHYYRKVINTSRSSLPDQHAASHDYYLATINNYQQSLSDWPDEVLGDGFNQSLLVNQANFSSPPQAAAFASMAMQTLDATTTPLNGFSTFGNVQQTGSTYRVTEAANAGIFKNLTLPIGAATLQFQLQVTTPGDGDFVSVHWNDGDALAIIPESSLAYDAPLLHEIDLSGLGGQSGTLTLKLISRGEVNSVVEVSAIGIVESDDVDGDGLSNAEESEVGSDLFAADSDGDSLTDGEEVHARGTHPMKRDTDGDGQDDASELAAGTDPLMPLSRFAATMGAVVPGVAASVRWNGIAGRNYRVVRSQELGSFNVDFLQSGVEGINGPMTYNDPNPPPLRAFYWIEVE